MSKLVLYDKNRNEDDAHIGQHTGHVMAYVKGTNVPLFEKWNKVIIPGSTFTARKHFPSLKVPVKLPTYNAAMDLENTMSITDQEDADSFVVLFAVGIDGCGPESSQVYDVDYTKWIAPANLVPFRYQISDNDLAGEKRNKYFGRKEITEADRVAYYFKAFDTEPKYIQQYVDGTAIDENIYTSDNTLNAESYVELKMSIDKEDCRDFFIATTGINDAKVNTISLLTAYPKTADGFTYYQNIRPLTKLNFPNEALIDLTKGIDIVYHIYY